MIENIKKAQQHWKYRDEALNLILSLAVVVDGNKAMKFIAVGTHRGLSAHLKNHRR